MRIAATAATLLFAMTACSTIESTVSPYQQPNELMSAEINQRIDQIPYQHRDELVQNLLWLAQTGEQTIPALIAGLGNENPKVRSSCCWVLGRLRDRRTVPALQSVVNDSETSVQMEACRTLVLMGDLEQSPKLIEGLDSDRKEVRYMCHEALKAATGHDFGYDHLNQDQQELQFAVLRWRQWWGEYGGDTFFASSYEQQHGLNNLAAPGGETQPQSRNSSNDSSVSKPGAPNSAATTTEPTQSTSESGNGSPQTGAPSALPPSVPATVPPTVPSTVPSTVPPTLPPTVPAVQVENVEVPEVSGQESNAGAGAGNAPKPGSQSNQATKPVPVIEVVPAAGGIPSSNASGATGTGSESGGN